MRRRGVLAVVGLVAFLPVACSGAARAPEGVAVRFTNSSAWGARVFGCGPCGSGGMGIVGDPEGGTPSPGAGAFGGWSETGPWPVAYRVVVRGVTSTCPQAPTVPKAVMRADELEYVIDATGRCVLAPVAWAGR